MPGRSSLAAATTIGLMLALVGPLTPAHADPTRDAEWHLAFLDIPRAQQVSQGDGVIVAVIDTGVDGNHPDLTGNVLPGVDMLSRQGDNGWSDTNGHGTAMAGLIAGHGRNSGVGVLGMAPKARILPIRTIGGGTQPTIDGNAAGIEVAIQRGARVISMSFGGAESPALRAAVEHAERAGVVLVAAVGNIPQDMSGISFPARYDGVVAVAATDRAGNHPDFSVTGPRVVISAPGVDITSTGLNNGYLTASGTSPATAIVAGVVALIRARYPSMPATEVIHRLTATATDKGAPGRDDEYGYGIVNPYAALTANVPPLAPSAGPSAPPSQAGRTAKDKTGVVVLVAAAVLVLLALAGLTYRRRRRT